MSTRLGLAALTSSLALAAACTGAEPTPPERLDLRVATGVPVLTPSGVAVDATGARFVFDDNFGLFRLDGTGGTLVMARAAMPDPGVVVRPPFTDMVALGGGRFALTAIGDGYLLDTVLGTMRRYFCYVPDGLPEPYDQRTDAVTYDPIAKLIYAQPRTFDEAGGLIDSQVATYSFETGADLTWSSVPLAIAAGGMVKLPGVDELLLGNGSELLRFANGGVSVVDDLAGLGVIAIDGLALDGDRLLVLDGPGGMLHTLDLASIVD